MTEAYDRARDILTRYADLHQTIAKQLMQVETLDAEAFEAFFQGLPGIPPRQEDPPPAPEALRQGRPAAPQTPADWPSGAPTPSPTPA